MTSAGRAEKAGFRIVLHDSNKDPAVANYFDSSPTRCFPDMCLKYALAILLTTAKPKHKTRVWASRTVHTMTTINSKSYSEISGAQACRVDTSACRSTGMRVPLSFEAGPLLFLTVDRKSSLQEHHRFVGDVIGSVPLEVHVRSGVADVPERDVAIPWMLWPLLPSEEQRSAPSGGLIAMDSSLPPGGAIVHSTHSPNTPEIQLP